MKSQPKARALRTPIDHFEGRSLCDLFAYHADMVRHIRFWQDCSAHNRKRAAVYLARAAWKAIQGKMAEVMDAKA